MYFYHNNSLGWLKIPKNACSSWESVFEQVGWQKEDLYDPQVDLNSLTFFGFLRRPDTRHDMGIVEYLMRSDIVDLLYDERFNRLLASAIFDEHTYGVWHMVPKQILDRTTFFIIDHVEFDYEKLTKNWLLDHGVDITNVPVPRLNPSNDFAKQLRNKIALVKQQNPQCHSKLMKNWLEPDVLLYAHHTQQQHHWDRYSG